MTLSNVLGPTDLVCRCLYLGGSDCEEFGGDAVELGDRTNPDVVLDEACPSELSENVVPAEPAESGSRLLDLSLVPAFSAE